MNLKKKVSYKKIRKGTKSQFYELMRKLFPLLKVSSISRKGIVRFKDKGIIPFCRKTNKVSIDTVLFTYLPKAMSTKVCGNTLECNVEHYNRKIRNLLSYNSEGNEIDNISQVITLFYNECFDKKAVKNEIVKKVYIVPTIKTDQEHPEDEELFEERGTANFLDWVFKPQKRSKIHLRLKKYVTAASLLSIVSAYAFVITCIQYKAALAVDNFCMRAPPLNTIFYNST